MVRLKHYFVRAWIATSCLWKATVSDKSGMMIDKLYPGTAVARMLHVRERVGNLTKEALNGDWENVRKSLLWAGGLRDLPTHRPGEGYTGHSFNDFNHCDLTTMLLEVANNEHDGSVKGIALGNFLGRGIQVASLPFGEEGSGSWTTCMMGCNEDPPKDVAHVQFRSRIAFKLVWCPPHFTSFVLVDDAGDLLASGTPSGILPPMHERMRNFALVQGSKYAVQAEAIGNKDEL